MSSNANLPPLQVWVHKDFLETESEHGTLISVRAQMNQALQFSVLLESGALYTGLPINAIGVKPFNNPYELQVAQAYDCISSNIEVIILEPLRDMKCTFLPFGHHAPQPAYYKFTIDFVETGLARHPTQWKQFHVLADESGRLVTYPQYRIQFKDSALCPNSKDKLPNYKYNTELYLSEK